MDGEGNKTSSTMRFNTRMSLIASQGHLTGARIVQSLVLPGGGRGRRRKREGGGRGKENSKERLS
jgi:hypothetical protein